MYCTCGNNTPSGMNWELAFAVAWVHKQFLSTNSKKLAPSLFLHQSNGENQGLQDMSGGGREARRRCPPTRHAEDPARIPAVASTTCTRQWRRDARVLGSIPFHALGSLGPLPFCATHAGLRVPLSCGSWDAVSLGCQPGSFESAPFDACWERRASCDLHERVILAY